MLPAIRLDGWRAAKKASRRAAKKAGGGSGSAGASALSLPNLLQAVEEAHPAVEMPLAVAEAEEMDAARLGATMVSFGGTTVFNGTGRDLGATASTAVLGATAMSSFELERDLAATSGSAFGPTARVAARTLHADKGCGAAGRGRRAMAREARRVKRAGAKEARLVGSSSSNVPATRCLSLYGTFKAWNGHTIFTPSTATNATRGSLDTRGSLPTRGSLCTAGSWASSLG